MYNYTPDKIIASLAENNYFANRRIAYAVLNAARRCVTSTHRG